MKEGEKVREIIIAIAHFVGWTNLSVEWKNWDGPDTQYVRGSPAGHPDCYEVVPNFYRDLNAIKLAEDKMSNEQYNGQFIHYLDEIMKRDQNHHRCFSPDAEQRAEALLKTVGCAGKTIDF